MKVESRLSGDGSVLTLAILGKFDFTLLNELRDAYTAAGDGLSGVNIDLRQTTAIDSSALGMLLSMKRHFGKADGAIRIINCSDDVRKILKIVRFDKKFSIE